MNRLRRITLREVYNSLENAKSDLQAMVEDLGGQRDEERETFDNMPEGLQQSPTGQAIEEAADALDEAFEEADEALSCLQRSLDKITEAVE